MKTAAIICEYNPFHNGHIYHLQKSLEKTNADASIAVMSGNFIQRGEPALFDKFSRAKAAVESGVDLVVELPSIYSSQSAELFAKGSVSLLNSLGCVNSICFGSEEGNINALYLIASILCLEPQEFKEKLSSYLSEGMLFPTARNKALFDYINSPDFSFGDNFNNFEIDGNIIKAQAGALLAVLGKAALREELTGFECISGIPGSLGGGLAMNAGAYGGEIKSVVKSVRVMNPKGEIFEFSNEEMKFEYRRSILTNSDYIVLSAVLELQKGNYDEIKAFMADLTNRRTTKQPLNLPSAGSTFKRPEGYFAAKLIDDCGLRGLTLRGAQVSEKHCGFVVNIGDATAKDILDLMYIVKSTVLNKFGVTLEEEVKILGED